MVTLDLSKYDEEASRKELAQELLDAVNTKGFFYLKNFGLSREEVDRQFGIGSEFYTTPLEERLKSKSDLEHGNSNGYSPAGKRDMGHGIMGESMSTAALLTGSQTERRSTMSPVGQAW